MGSSAGDSNVSAGNSNVAAGDSNVSASDSNVSAGDSNVRLASVLFGWRQECFGMHLQPNEKLAAKMNYARSSAVTGPQRDVQSE